MHNVGDVLYLLSNKNQKIVPARVDSVITVKKVDGEQVTHELSFPGMDKTAVLEKLDVTPFDSASALREHMLELLRPKVDTEINSVCEQATQAWGSHGAERNPGVVPLAGAHDEIALSTQDSGLLQVDLPDGIKARVHLPKELM